MVEMRYSIIDIDTPYSVMIVSVGSECDDVPIQGQGATTELLKQLCSLTTCEQRPVTMAMHLVHTTHNILLIVIGSIS